MSNALPTANMQPFWGKYVLRSLQEGPQKNDQKAEKSRKERLRKLFQMVDDYVEQA